MGLPTRLEPGTIADLSALHCFAMDDWTDGYATEIPYSVNHFPEMAPAHLNLALLHLGRAAPSLEQAFTYLELGFGQGLGLNMLAATHPQGQFFGNDFMPAHVQGAQRLAEHAGLSNLHLFEDSFAQLLTRDLPPMDYIVLHGVYTWVNDENRSIIVALLGKLLKSQGVVYVSYNCLPGWSVKAPLQRLMSEFAQAQTDGTVLERYRAARDFLGALEAADAAFFVSNSAARGMLREISQASDAYLLHEFAPKGWAPFYHCDVARHLASADLRYAGSAKLFNNFPAYSLRPETRVLLEATPDAGLRETVRDFAMQTTFRRDIFVRDARALDDADIAAQYRELKFALWRPPASCALSCQIPVGALQLDEASFRPLLNSLSQGPQDLQSLLALAPFAELGPARCIDAINVLLCLDYIGIAPRRPLQREAAARLHALNRTLAARLLAGERLSGFASASLGAAIAISYHDLLFLAAHDAGCMSAEALAAFALRVLSSCEGEASATALDREAANFLKYGLDFYRSLDLF